MNIFYYTWSESTQSDMLSTFKKFGYNVFLYSKEFSNYDFDDSFSKDFEYNFINNKCDVIFTFDFFPIIARISKKLNVKYISWTYDCPNFCLFSNTILYDQVYLFLFDKEQTKQIKKLGAKHAFHLPLGVNTARLENLINNSDSNPYTNKHTSYDISFVGSLYKNIPFDTINYLPEYINGYVNGLIASQHEIWGMDLITPNITDDIVSEMLKYLNLPIEPDYYFTSKDFMIDFIQSKLTQLERINYLDCLGNHFATHLFTNTPHQFNSPVVVHDPIDYNDEMPLVFNRSKLNLNITLRSITQGIPLRVLDIMASKGFMITNFQGELLDDFVPDQEFVYFEDEKDLIEKCGYYLENSQARTRIIDAAFYKLKSSFDYNSRLEVLISNSIKS